MDKKVLLSKFITSYNIYELFDEIKLIYNLDGEFAIAIKENPNAHTGIKVKAVSVFEPEDDDWFYFEPSIELQTTFRDSFVAEQIQAVAGYTLARLILDEK